MAEEPKTIDAAKWVEQSIAGEKIDSPTQMLMYTGLAIAGKNWELEKERINDLPPEEKIKAIRALAEKSIDESPYKAAAGTSEPVKEYANELIDRSVALDPSGAKLSKFMDTLQEVSAPVTLEQLKSGNIQDLAGLDLNAIKETINISADANIDDSFRDNNKATKTLEKDFLESLEKAEKDKDGKTKYTRKTVTEPVPMEGGLLEMLLRFLMAIFTGDMSIMSPTRTITNEVGGEPDPAKDAGGKDKAPAALDPKNQVEVDEMHKVVPVLAAGNVLANRKYGPSKEEKAEIDNALDVVAEYTGLSAANLKKLSADQQRALGASIVQNINDQVTEKLTSEQVKNNITHTAIFADNKIDKSELQQALKGLNLGKEESTLLDKNNDKTDNIVVIPVQGKEHEKITLIGKLNGNELTDVQIQMQRESGEVVSYTSRPIKLEGGKIPPDELSKILEGARKSSAGGVNPSKDTFLADDYSALVAKLPKLQTGKDAGKTGP